MSLAYLVMAAETTLLFSASATVQSSTALPTKSWPFKKKWWRSWTCFSFFFFLSLAVSSLFLVHPTRLSFFPYHWSFVYVRLEGKFCLPFAPCFASLLSLVPASAEALRLLASVQRFASEAAICDLQMTWARSCWWLLRSLLQINPGNVWYDATGKQPSCYQHWQIAVFLTQNRTSVFSLAWRTDRRMALSSVIPQVQNI